MHLSSVKYRPFHFGLNVIKVKFCIFLNFLHPNSHLGLGYPKARLTKSNCYHFVKCIFFPVFWHNILSEMSKVTFEISHKIVILYTAKYEFYKVCIFAWFTISLNRDVISLSETAACFITHISFLVCLCDIAANINFQRWFRLEYVSWAGTNFEEVFVLLQWFAYNVLIAPNPGITITFNSFVFSWSVEP